MRHLRISLFALTGAVAGGLLLATIGSTGVRAAVGASLLMGATVAVVTFVILRRVVPESRQAEVVSTAIPDLGGHDDPVDVAMADPDVRPDPFALGWQKAERDPATTEHELRAWEDWTSTLAAESADAPVWADEPRALSFDFKRWLPTAVDRDTVELPAIQVAEEPAVVRSEPVPVEASPPPAEVRPVLPADQGFPEFAPWPDAPWRRVGRGEATEGRRIDA